MIVPIMSTVRKVNKIYLCYSPRSATTATMPSFNGRLQQVVINGKKILDEAHLHQLQHEGEFLLSSLLYTSRDYTVGGQSNDWRLPKY